jgi:hypothetical protein
MKGSITFRVASLKVCRFGCAKSDQPQVLREGIRLHTGLITISVVLRSRLGLDEHT